MNHISAAQNQNRRQLPPDAEERVILVNIFSFFFAPRRARVLFETDFAFPMNLDRKPGRKVFLLD
jgi:hypothetical protein